MSDPYVGEIRLFSFNFPPKGWALCDGQTMAINQNAALYSLIGTQFGGDGRVNFALPDLRGRVPMHTDVSHPQGVPGGQEQVTLTMSTLPTHSHDVVASNQEANKNGVGNNANRYLGQVVDGMAYSAPTGALTALGPDAITPSGSAAPYGHNNMQPYQVISFAIALTGYYPQRP